MWISTFSLLLFTGVVTSEEELACIDDSDCVHLGHKYSCFLYYCHNWVDPSPAHPQCQADWQCNERMKAEEEYKCFRHWNLREVDHGVCFTKYQVTTCDTASDCKGEDHCCGMYCCSDHYYRQWQSFSCFSDMQCKSWKTGQFCCNDNLCCDDRKVEIKRISEQAALEIHKQADINLENQKKVLLQAGIGVLGNLTDMENAILSGQEAEPVVEITKLDETEEAEYTTQAESDDSDTSENKAIVNVEKSENASETSEIETETSEVNLAESLPVEDTQTNEIPDVDKAFEKDPGTEATEDVFETADDVSETADDVSETADDVSETADDVSDAADEVSETADDVSETADGDTLNPAVDSETADEVSETTNEDSESGEAAAKSSGELEIGHVEAEDIDEAAAEADGKIEPTAESDNNTSDVSDASDASQESAEAQEDSLEDHHSHMLDLEANNLETDIAEAKSSEEQDSSSGEVDLGEEVGGDGEGGDGGGEEEGDEEKYEYAEPSVFTDDDFSSDAHLEESVQKGLNLSVTDDITDSKEEFDGNDTIPAVLEEDIQPDLSEVKEVQLSENNLERIVHSPKNRNLVVANELSNSAVTTRPVELAALLTSIGLLLQFRQH